jgi:SGNH domain (fused to AT3 domains)
MIVLSFVFVGRNGAFPAPNGLLPTLGTVLILAFASRETITGRFLASPPMVYVGRLSYSWYLTHWPAILFLRPLEIDSPWIQGLVGLALGMICHHWIERPTRTIPESRVLTRVLLPTLAIGSLAIVLPHLGLRVVPATQGPTQWCDCDLHPRDASKATGAGCVESGLVGDVSTGLRRSKRIPGPLKALILGDSHAKSWMPGIDAALGELGWHYVAFPAIASSPFFIPENSDAKRYGHEPYWPSNTRQEFDQHRRRFIASNTVPLVILCSRWSNYLKWTQAEFDRDFEELLRTFPTSQVLVIGQPPELPFGTSGLSTGPIDLGRFTPFRERATAREGRAQIHARIREIMRRHPRVRFLETESHFLQDGVIRPFKDGQVLYRDDDHISLEGALLLTSTFREAFLQALKTPPTQAP